MKRLILLIPYFFLAVFALLLIASEANDNVNTSSDKIGNQNLPIVIIDAGHGGEDGGAVSADGTQEQYINLDIALKLNDILKLGGFKTVLTRSDDNSIHDENAKTIRARKVSDIHNRLKIVEETDNCILVSIHQNFFTQSRYSGAQVFYSVNNPESEKLAECIQSDIVSRIQNDNTRLIKPCGKSVYLLYYATKPSVMVECGFLSNPTEASLLNDENYRLKMATAVFCGILDYINLREER